MSAAGVDLDALLARCTFPKAGTTVACGVSGGADSVALLALACRAGCVATAVHVDHGLRPGGEPEAALVQRVATSLGAEMRATRVEVERGPNLEARARRARHEALGPDALLGHTMDDQAETVLLAMLRGAAVDGLAGMRPDRRPMLGLRRSETRAVCEALGLATFEDPSNSDPAFRRNRVRHELLPLLCDIAARDVVPVLARQAAVLRGVAGYLASEAASVDPTDTRAAAQVPEPVLREALRTWLRSVSPEGHPPDGASLERVLAVVRGEHVATQVAGGIRIARTDGRLRIVHDESDGSDGRDSLGTTS